MPTIKIETTDPEYAKLITAKSQLGLDWREILFKGADLQQPNSRRLGRPPASALDDLFEYGNNGPVSHASPISSETGPSEALNDEMAQIYAPWAKKKKEPET